MNAEDKTMFAELVFFFFFLIQIGESPEVQLNIEVSNLELCLYGIKNPHRLSLCYSSHHGYKDLAVMFQTLPV